MRKQGGGGREERGPCAGRGGTQLSIWPHVPLCMTCCLLSNVVLSSFQPAARVSGPSRSRGQRRDPASWVITSPARPCRRRSFTEDGRHSVRVVQTLCRTPGEDPKPIRHPSRANVGDQSGVKTAPATKISRRSLHHLPADVDHLGHSILVAYVHQILAGSQCRACTGSV